MKSSNLCPKKRQAVAWTQLQTPVPLLFYCLTNYRFFLCPWCDVWVIILLSVNLIPLLPTGVLGSSAANKEHISREDKTVEKGKMAGIQRAIKAELDTKYNLPLVPNAETLLHNILGKCS